ncbi:MULTISPECIES: RteC domain-containing protein [Chryseobacterium]|uniref:RteC protein n=2 Tax=Chryseobacterium gleum TaxID=250 RepID=A0A3S4QZW5_CHRGE|nr:MULTISPECIES: RteC domain-containing protein [Chryseobacterium]HAF32957.1 RteC protein [Sphingobacterium sp.]EFK36155.1 RteC protein [Chryseobacterium gleum ATCC 35910]QQY31851.1 RteC domain-containing protein [Chryseobacterium gleum]VEE11023.1 RteC protein [Chryseobacterium gleum]VFA43920.1 RteC protein [Chryseobacterium indologenes]
MKQAYKNILLSIEKEEINVSRSKKSAIDEAYHMVSFLDKTLTELKAQINLKGFESILDEIIFFKRVKPEILGMLMFYNKVVKIEAYSPINSELTEPYYTEQVRLLNKEYKKHIASSDFYSYYRTGRSDKDEYYFRLGNINYFDGVDSFFFEVDREFSTYYDYKIAQIKAYDLYHSYLSGKFNRQEPTDNTNFDINEDAEFSWTDSKNALIELIYALHISRSVSNGRVGLRKISQMFEDIFEVSLGDIHHAFYQMKFRAGQRARYLHFLKHSLEQYMDNDL